MRTCSPVCKWRCASTEHKAKQACSPPLRQHNPCCLERLDVRHPHPPGCVSSGRRRGSVGGGKCRRKHYLDYILCPALYDINYWHKRLAPVYLCTLACHSLWYAVISSYEYFQWIHTLASLPGTTTRRCGQTYTAPGI